jgi:FlaA1/EpsC-like NDP-sugar epimerase
MKENYKKLITKEFKNKKILITGGTGSIGLGLCKQILELSPSEIRIYSNDENSFFESGRELGYQPCVKYMMGDIRDKERLKLAMREIDYVFHAAAMKHLDICEQNPFDAVQTNVVGTANVIEASLIENISKFIFISTDKATNPTSTLGASKMLAERLTISANNYRGKAKTIFSIVRFGNVLGSRGSVFQIFLDQIRNNSPLTVADEKMTRFIMSISDAALLILRVCCIAKNGEIFVLKMPSVRIIDLARMMVAVYKEQLSLPNYYPKFKKFSSRERERFQEFLITKEELSFCYDIGDMYKISISVNPKPLSFEQFDSNKIEKISSRKLKLIIKELIREYSLH